VSPDATLPPGLPSVLPNATPLTAGPAPPAAQIAGLRITPLGTDGSVSAASVALGDLRGSRATVVAFWATNCAPCEQELPALQALEPSLRAQGGRLLLVDVREGPSTVAAWLRDHGIRLATWLDPDGSVRDALGLLALPVTAVLAPDGSLLYPIEGDAVAGGLREYLASMGISAQ
jgi:thiol-disulfide isomerase/thioredoxin